MPSPRSNQVSLTDTSYYHCVSRCVRRAFLCGDDPLTGRSYAHRRGWVEEKLLELPNYFAISVCAYAVMSNHTHVVLNVDDDSARSWSLREVVERWHGLFAGTSLSQRWLAGQSLGEAETRQLVEQAEVWRERLTSISWFMRCLNESIARQANAEDKCTGRFWEGRFKSQALLDEAAIVACLAYVDLNPVRAGMADTPESSEFTSVRRRIQCLLLDTEADKATDARQPTELAPFVGHLRTDMPPGLPFALADYIELVQWSGRIMREDKPGHILADCPPLLDRLQLSAEAWERLTLGLEQHFCSAIGAENRMQAAAQQRQCAWLRGTGAARVLFNSA